MDKIKSCAIFSSCFTKKYACYGNIMDGSLMIKQLGCWNNSVLLKTSAFESAYITLNMSSGQLIFFLSVQTSWFSSTALLDEWCGISVFSKPVCVSFGGSGSSYLSMVAREMWVELSWDCDSSELLHREVLSLGESGHVLQAFSTTGGEQSTTALTGETADNTGLPWTEVSAFSSLLTVKGTSSPDSCVFLNPRGDCCPSGGENERDEFLHFIAVSATVLKNRRRPRKWLLLPSTPVCSGVEFKSLTSSKLTEP